MGSYAKWRGLQGNKNSEAEMASEIDKIYVGEPCPELLPFEFTDLAEAYDQEDEAEQDNYPVNEIV